MYCPSFASTVFHYLVFHFYFLPVAFSVMWRRRMSMQIAALSSSHKAQESRQVWINNEKSILMPIVYPAIDAEHKQEISTLSCRNFPTCRPSSHIVDIAWKHSIADRLCWGLQWLCIAVSFLARWLSLFICISDRVLSPQLGGMVELCACYCWVVSEPCGSVMIILSVERTPSDTRMHTRKMRTDCPEAILSTSGLFWWKWSLTEKPF